MTVVAAPHPPSVRDSRSPAAFLSERPQEQGRTTTPQQMPRATVVLPTYDEAANLPSMIGALLAVHPPVSVLVVGEHPGRHRRDRRPARRRAPRPRRRPAPAGEDGPRR